MAIHLEAINLIIPIENIERCKSIGGFEGYLKRQGLMLGEIVWHDGFLVREGAMNPMDIPDMIDEWAEHGLVPIVETEDGNVFNDLCIIDTQNGLTLPCDWIEFDLKERVAWMKDRPRGKVVGPRGGPRDMFPL